MRNPLVLLGVGFLLLIIGWALPILMIMQFIESTFLMNFLSYIASFLGLIIGVIGSVLFVSRFRNKE